MDALKYWRRFELLDDFWYKWLVLVCILVGVIGLVLNCFVIHFLLRSSKASKATSNRYLLVNLALSDIVKLASNVSLRIGSTVSKHWIFGDLGCQIYGFIDGFAGLLSTSTLTIMAIERYYMIKNPLNALKNKSESIILIIFAAWLYSIFWTTIQLFSERGFVLEGMLTSCTFDYWSRDFKSRFIMMSILFAGFILPFVLLVVFYSLVLRALKLKVRSFSEMLGSELLGSNSSCKASFLITSKEMSDRSRRLRRPVCRNEPDTPPVPNNIVRRRSKAVMQALIVPVQINLNKVKVMRKLMKREFKVTKSVVVCIGVFCISWLPYTVIIILAQFGTNVENYITPLTVSLPSLFAKITTILNPLIYTLINPECRGHLKRLFGIKSKL